MSSLLHQKAKLGFEIITYIQHQIITKGLNLITLIKAMATRKRLVVHISMCAGWIETRHALLLL